LQKSEGVEGVALVKIETSLTFYGGVNEIGGNKILLKDGDTKIFFDFGMSFGMKRLFYSPPFLSPKSEKSLQEFGILPKLDGVYRFDEKQPDIDAIFISHGHLDHCAYLSFVKREIPIYCGQTTKIILQSLGDIRRTDLEFDVRGLNFNTFRTGEKIRCGNLEIEPIHVDHSVPGAYGFVVHTSNGSLAYTGDFRHHGAKSEMTDDFTKKACESEVTTIITEATNMTGASVSSEREVENKLDTIIGQTDGIVLGEFAYADIDRFNSFFRVAKRNNRCLAISLRQAYLLESFRADKGLNLPDISDENILLFRKSKATNYKWEKRLVDEYPGKVKGAFELSKRQCNVVLAISFYDLEELVEIQPKSGSCYILSASEPFNEEMEIDFERLVNWLDHFGLPQYHVHVSGHMMPLQLKSTLEKINAKTVFPVHTENAQLFCRFMQNLRSKIVLTEKNKNYSI
jgi:ribonuclease J